MNTETEKSKTQSLGYTYSCLRKLNSVLYYLYILYDNLYLKPHTITFATGKFPCHFWVPETAILIQFSVSATTVHMEPLYF